jgi:hypothetical protein
VNKKYYIYKITNILNDKIYIDQTIQPKIRWRTHKHLAKHQKTNQYIHKAMNKYGCSKICNAPGCERTDDFKVNGVRYCNMHEQRLRRSGSLELNPQVPWNKGKRSKDTNLLK